MAIRTVPKENTPNNTSAPEKKDFSELAFFIAINLLVLPFSAYQTYIGYNVFTGPIGAVAIAAISTILFAAMNFGIRDRRRKGKAHGMQVIMYLIPLGFSFPGNFTAFYTQQMKTELYGSEISEYKNVFDKTTSEGIESLKESTGVNDLTANYERLMNDLEVQYNGNPAAGIPSGWGPDCNGHWKKINSLLKESDPSGQGIGNELRRETFEGAEALSQPVYGQLINSKNQDIQVFLDDISSTKFSIDSIIKVTKDNEDILKLEGKSIIDNIAINNNRIASDVEAYLKNHGGASLNYSELKPSAQNQLDSIKFAMGNGFIEMPSPSATYFSLFLSLIIDLAALLYILFFVASGKQKVKGRINKPTNIN